MSHLPASLRSAGKSPVAVGGSIRRASSRQVPWAWVWCLATVILAVNAAVLIHGRTFDGLIEEDGPIEWLGTIGFFVASGCFFAAWRQSRRNLGSTPQLVRWSLLALAILFFGFGGEEISWGQRLLGISTPESLGAVNVQDETNLHNLSFFQNTLSVGRIFQLYWWTFGIAIPVAAAFSARFRAFLVRRIPVLPLWIAGLFASAQILSELVQVVIEARPSLYRSTYPIYHSTTEIVEANVGLLFGVAAFVVYRSVADGEGASPA